MENNKYAVACNDVDELSQPVVTKELIGSENFCTAYANLTQTLKTLDEVKKTVDTKIKSIIEQEYLECGNQTLIGNGYRFTYVPMNYKESFDLKQFKNDHPDLYNQYVKLTPTSPALRSTKQS